jgi:hypothetical protein
LLKIRSKRDNKNQTSSDDSSLLFFFFLTTNASNNSNNASKTTSLLFCFVTERFWRDRKMIHVCYRSTSAHCFAREGSNTKTTISLQEENRVTILCTPTSSNAYTASYFDSAQFGIMFTTENLQQQKIKIKKEQENTQGNNPLNSNKIQCLTLRHTSTAQSLRQCLQQKKKV